MRYRLGLLALLYVTGAAPKAGRADHGQQPPGARSVSAHELLQDSDRARGGISEGLTWTVEIKVNEGTTQREARTYLVKARGNDALAEALAPAKNKGEILLFNDRALWFIKPTLRKPVSLSTRQKLTGDAANGDIASTNYARDYEGTIDGEDTVQGEPAYRLQLKARSAKVTYDRITYWVSKSRHLGLKAEFRTVSNAVFKTATFQYGNKIRYQGKELDLITKMTITDGTDKTHVTTLFFTSAKAERHAESAFNINNVMR